METVLLHSQSMCCQGCVNAIEACLIALDGVESAKADLSDKSIIVTFDPERISLDDIKRRLRLAGFVT